MAYKLVLVAVTGERIHYFTKKYLIQNLGFTTSTAEDLLSNLPAVIFESEKLEQVQEIRNALEKVGASVQINQPQIKYCPHHIDQQVSGRCALCLQALCPKCKQKAQGAELCYGCWDQQARRRRWRRNRQLAAFAVLIIVAGIGAKTYYEDRRKLAWDRTYTVALVEIVKVNHTGKPNQQIGLTAESYQKLAKILENWFYDEFFRITGKTRKPFRFERIGPIKTEEAPPMLPTASDGWWTRYKQTTGFIKFFTQSLERSGQGKDRFDIYIYLYATDEDIKRRHSVGTTRGRLGVVFLAAGKPLDGRTICTIAHELLHTVGAKDKYDGNDLTIYPDGYLQPERRYPQVYAEIMALAIPIGPGKEKDADNLTLTRVGPKTAAEIGWQR